MTRCARSTCCWFPRAPCGSIPPRRRCSSCAMGSARSTTSSARSPRATRAPISAPTFASWSTRWLREDSWSMQQRRPSTLIAELSYQCPLDIGGETYRRELETEEWIRAFREARGLGVLQLALTGGEPMLRRDLVELCVGARDAGLYSSLITAGTLFTRERAEALKSAGLDHVQISIQSPDPEDNDRIAGNMSF